MKMKSVFVIFFGILLVNPLLGATVTSNGAGGGNWSDGSALGPWFPSAVPAAGDNVVITAGDVVVADVTTSCKWIDVNGTLTINGGVVITVNGCDGGNGNTQQFTIYSGGTVTVNGSLVLDPNGCGPATYENIAGGTLTNTGTLTVDNDGDLICNGNIANSGTMNITSTSGNSNFDNNVNFNNTGGIINVNNNSSFQNFTGASFTAGNGTINFNAGSTYEHGLDAGTIPTATWNSTSTCLVTGITSTVPTALGQSFGNFTWTCSQAVATLNLNGALTTITGNFTINNISPNAARTFYLSQTTSYTLNITGDFIINAPGTTDVLQFCTTVSPTINVGGNFSLLTSGRITMSTSGSPTLNITGNFTHSSTMSLPFTMGGSGSPTINITGNFTYSANVANGLRMSIGTGTGTINLYGNFTYSPATASRITETAGGKGKFFFKKAGTQTFTTASVNPFANTIELTVDASSTLDMSATTTSLALVTSTGQFLTVNGALTMGTKTLTTTAGTTFTLASGGTLNTSNASGVNPTIVAGGTRNFNNAANYVLAGASTTTGFTGANTTMNDLTLTATAVLGEAIVVNGTLLNSSGTFSPSGFTITAGAITNNATITAGAGMITATGAFTNSGTFTANTSTLNVGGNFSNGGTFTANTGTVVFNGATQTIGGASVTTFNNITQSSTVSTSLAVDANLIGVLSISDGTFTTTGFNFTLVSDASGTASIGEITGSGSFSGNIIMQRYVASSPTDWRFFCSPVSGASISDWADDFATSGFTGATCGPADCADPNCSATCGYPSIYWYDESQAGDLDQGYTAIADVTDPIVDGTGYWVYLGPSPVTFEVTGPPNKFAQPLVAAYNPNNGIADDGWNLVSNPYPCAIDWDDVAWTKTSVDDAVYVYNASTGSYASYIAGFGTNGGTKNIASQQAFWIKANTDAPAPVLNAAEAVKITGVAPSFLRTNREPNTSNYPSTFKDFPVPQNVNNVVNSLRLVATGNGHDDEMLIRFKQNATNSFDGKYDAWKLMNPDTASVLDISSVVGGSTDVSINTLPPLTSDVNISIRLKVPVTGNYQISRDSMLMLPLSSCIVLEDLQTSTFVDLRTTVTYTFTMTKTVMSNTVTVAPRFVLHIYSPVTKSSVRASCSYGNNGLAIAKGIGAGPWNYTWKNSSGTTVKTTTGSLTADTLFNCSSGTYSVSVNGAYCGTVTDTIQVAAPAVLAINPSFVSPLCFGGNNGTAFVVPSGGTPSYSYLWNNGETTSAISALSFGNYSVTMTDAHACISTASFTVSQPTVVLNSVSQATVTCFGGTDGSAFVSTAGGAAPYSYVWNNGQSIAGATNLSFGNYSCLVTDAQGCTSTATVSVAQPAAITSTVVPTNISCYGQSDGSFSITGSGGAAPFSFNWPNGDTVSTTSNFVAGVYPLMITDANGCIATATVTLTQPVLLTSGHTASSYSVDIALGSNVTFTNASSGAVSYQWNFGDASGFDNSTNPTHSYTATGTYTVTLVSSDGPCSDTSYSVIVVINSNPTALHDSQYSSFINVGYENGDVFLLFSFDRATRIDITVYNMLGESIFEKNNLTVSKEKIKIDIPAPAPGIYIAVTEMTDAAVAKKIIIPVR